MKKRFFLILCLAMYLCLNLSVAAKEDCNGDLDYSEGGEPYIPLPDQDSLENEKLGLSLYLVGNENFAKTLNVPCYQQENGHYCAPATCQQVIKYVTGTSYTQTQLAEKLKTTLDGTDMTKVAPVMKSLTGKNYIMSPIVSVYKWRERIKTGMNNNMPPILDINTQNVSGWPYATSGHFINISGINIQNGNPILVRITDPYVKGLGNKWYTEDQVYAANSAHFRQSMIW